jgi:hypothetical protein
VKDKKWPQFDLEAPSDNPEMHHKNICDTQGDPSTDPTSEGIKRIQSAHWTHG